MTQSRRQRTQKEGTFLELVKASLETLVQEVAEIKLAVAGIKALQLNTGSSILPEYQYAVDGSAWETWPPWCFDEATLLSTECHPYYPTTVAARPNPEPKPAASCYGREFLLTYRCDSEVMEVPAQIKTLSAKAFGTDSEVYKLWLPASGNVFQDSVALRNELEEESAAAIQRWYRSLGKQKDPAINETARLGQVPHQAGEQCCHCFHWYVDKYTLLLHECLCHGLPVHHPLLGYAFNDASEVETELQKREKMAQEIRAASGNVDDETVPEFSALQMRAIIDYVIDGLLQKPCCSKLPAGFFDQTADKLKQIYGDCEDKKFSKTDARKLMALTTEMCTRE